MWAELMLLLGKTEELKAHAAEGERLFLRPGLAGFSSLRTAVEVGEDALRGEMQGCEPASLYPGKGSSRRESSFLARRATVLRVNGWPKRCWTCGRS